MAITLSFPTGGALVVGGAGRVGAGIVRQMALAGVPLWFTYRGGAERALKLEAELRAAGHDVTAARLDFSDEAATGALMRAIAEKTERLHSVFCTAAPPVPFRRMADFLPEEIDAFFREDALAHFRLYRQAVLLMRGSGGGSITVCTTMANNRVLDYDGISAISKGSVESLARYVAAEEGRHGIRCNNVAIGWTSSDPMEVTMAQLPPVKTDGPPETEIEMMTDLLHNHTVRSRLGRNSTPEEAGNVFAFLASDQAGFITGQTIVFDGGITL